MGVPQYTTPTFILTFDEEGLDLTEAQNVYVTFTSGNTSITKTGEDLTVEAKAISVYLNQGETGRFRQGDVEIQANWTEANGERAASEIEYYQISGQLLKRVVT